MCFEEDPTKDSQKYKSIGYRRAAIMSPEISRGVIDEIQSLNQRLHLTVIRGFGSW